MKGKQKENSHNLEIEKDLLLEHLLNYLPVHVYWQDTEGRILGCNKKQAESLGFGNPSEIVGKYPDELLSKKEAMLLMNVLAEVTKEGKPVSIEEKTVLKNGTSYFISYKIPIKTKIKEIIGLLGISVEITERKKIELELRRTKQRLENVLDTIPGHVYWKDTNGVYLGCNELQAKADGIPKDEVIGKTDYDLMPKEVADRVTKVDQEVITQKKAKTIEEVGLVHGKERIFLSRKVPLYDIHKKDKVIGLLGVSLDITDQKLTEQQLTEAKHKLEGMTLVSASVAHELRTPLQALSFGIDGLRKFLPTLIEGYKKAEASHLLSNTLKPSTIDSLDGLLDSMDSELSASAMTIDLLLMNLKTNIEKQEVLNETFLISEIIHESVHRYPFQEGQDELVNILKGNDFLVKGNKMFVTHILFNLIKNALYHIAKARKGEISIWLEKGEDLEKNYLFFKDTGSGMKKEVLAHVFEKFFTKTNHGAGIGLSYCKMVMGLMGGKISCDSIEGEYTLFKLEFPNTG